LYGRPIGTKLEDVAQAQEQMGETGKTVAGLLCEWCDWGIALSDGFQWYDSIGMLPIIPTSFGDNIGRFVAKYSDEAIVALRNVPAFQKFARWSFRENLARLTGFMPTNQFEAHHVLPQKYVQRFSDAGINIHDPIYGSWVEKTSHSQWSYQYNQDWKQFFADNNSPTQQQILDVAQQLSERYGFNVNFP
jgi:hypothetical protein